MRRIVIALGLLGMFSAISCQKCKQCSYTYTKIETIQTVNGEEEVITTETGWVENDTGGVFNEECIKRNESFTIEDAYKLEQSSTDKPDFEYTCTDL